MDEFLNELYGTSETVAGEEGLEKQAAAEFLVKMAAEEGVDLDTLSDEEVSGLLSEIEGDMGKEASAQEGAEETTQEEDMAKMAEADFLGRQMAHAYVNELAEIEKQAAMIGPQIGTARLGYRKLMSRLGKAGDKAKEYAGKAGEATGLSQIGRGGKKAVRGLKAHSAEGKRIKKDYGEIGLKNLHGARSDAMKEGLKEMGEGGKRFGKRVAAPAAALETVRRVGKAQGGSEKNSFDADFESAAQERAYEMLAEAGYDVEKVAAADIDTMALQMLEQAGYPVEW